MTTTPVSPGEPAVALFAGDARARAAWATALQEAAVEADLPLRLRLDPASADLSEIDYVLLDPDGPAVTLTAFPKLRVVLSLWAGVERILERDDLPDHAPITRMVEPGMVQGMTDYVVGHVMRLHLNLDAVVARSRDARWEKAHPPLSTTRRVGVMGLGALGMEAARALAAIGFAVAGWSRTRKGPGDGLPEGVEAFAGMQTLDGFLARSEILVILLPLTQETTGLLAAERLAALPSGAHLINAARGPIVPEADLLSALGPADGDGPLASAVLDVFDQEPLPAEHPFWSHPRVLVTPHVASVTRPETASLEIIRQIIRDRSGQPLRHVVARDRGY